MSTTFDSILSDVFDRGAERRLTEDAEREAIHASRRGDESATVALLYAYAPALRRAAARYRSVLEPEEARSACVLALLSAVRDFDAEHFDRLAAYIVSALAEELSRTVAEHTPVAIPPRTRRRFFHILRAAEGDVIVAAAMAPSFAMSRETFHAVLDAVRVASTDEQRGDGDEGRTARVSSIWSDEYADAADRVLCELAFSVVDDLETDVCRMAYGFADYAPVADAEIAHRLGHSRPKIQRVRSGALVKMRAALGA